MIPNCGEAKLWDIESALYIFGEPCPTLRIIDLSFYHSTYQLATLHINRMPVCVCVRKKHENGHLWSSISGKFCRHDRDRALRASIKIITESFWCWVWSDPHLCEAYNSPVTRKSFVWSITRTPSEDRKFRLLEKFWVFLTFYFTLFTLIVCRLGAMQTANH